MPLTADQIETLYRHSDIPSVVASSIRFAQWSVDLFDEIDMLADFDAMADWSPYTNPKDGRTGAKSSGGRVVYGDAAQKYLAGKPEKSTTAKTAPSPVPTPVANTLATQIKDKLTHARTIAEVPPEEYRPLLDQASKLTHDQLRGVMTAAGIKVWKSETKGKLLRKLDGYFTAGQKIKEQTAHSEFSDTAPTPTDQVALAGPDGRRAAELLGDAKRRGGEVLNHLARRAVTRILKSDDPVGAVESVDSLLNDEERAALADALAAVTATADLLGRSRVRERAHQAELRYTQHVEFAEGDSFQSFVDPPPPVPPTKAIDYFRSLVPGLAVDPATFGPQIYQQAFTMAATADAALLGRVKDLILGALETGEVSSAPQMIEDVLNAAGVTPKNPQYSSMLWRSNAMNAYNRGAVEELQSPGMEDYFPVWQYAGIADGRERARHHVHFDRYYPNSATFEEVRDSELGEYDGFNCRCTMIPVDKFSWAELQSNGAKIADGW